MKKLSRLPQPSRGLRRAGQTGPGHSAKGSALFTCRLMPQNAPSTPLPPHLHALWMLSELQRPIRKTWGTSCMPSTAAMVSPGPHWCTQLSSPPPQLCKETAHGVDSSTCVELTARRDAWQIHRADLLILFPHFPGENREVLETW